jgi:hypothetical protein
VARLRLGSDWRGWGRAWRAAVLVVVVSLTAAASANATTGAFAPSPLQHVRADGISIGYHTIGSGSPLVMIMGFSGTRYIWDPALLAEQHRLIVFDNRGVAQHARPGTTEHRSDGR